MQLKLGITLISGSLVLAMNVPIKYGGYVIVYSLLIAGVAFVVTSPPLPGFRDDDPFIPAPRSRPTSRLRRAKQKSRGSAASRWEDREEDNPPHGPSTPAA